MKDLVRYLRYALKLELRDDGREIARKIITHYFERSKSESKLTLL